MLYIHFPPHRTHVIALGYLVKHKVLNFTASKEKL